MELKKYEVKITPIILSPWWHIHQEEPDSESWPPSPDDTSNKLTNLSKKPWDNGIFDELLPQKICQIILYKCIIQEKENMYILNLFQFNEKYYFLMLTLLVFADD